MRDGALRVLLPSCVLPAQSRNLRLRKIVHRRYLRVQPRCRVQRVHRLGVSFGTEASLGEPHEEGAAERAEPCCPLPHRLKLGLGDV
jgi:hypothetical protein